jgi:hypothetical protein
VTISAVAQEAGQSRTLIGHEGCTYPRARAAILAAMKPVAQPRTAAEIINRKRDEVAALREAVAIRDSVNAALVARLAKVEAQATRALRQAGRELSKATAEPNHAADMKLMAESDTASPDEVISLRPNQGPGRHDQR